MTLSRRSFLGVALGGGLSAAGASAFAEPFVFPRMQNPAADTLVLMDSIAPAFGAAAQCGGPVVVADGLPALAAAAAWLDARPGRRVVGLVSESHGVLFRQLVHSRSKWLVIGHHREGGDGHHQSRHCLTVAPASRGIGHALATAIAAQRGDFSVTEEGIGAPSGAIAPAMIAMRAEQDAPAGWQARLGELLVSVADGSWRPRPVAPSCTYVGDGQRGSNRDVALTSFVVS